MMVSNFRYTKSFRYTKRHAVGHSGAVSWDVGRKTGFTLFSDYRVLLAIEPYF